MKGNRIILFLAVGFLILSSIGCSFRPKPKNDFYNFGDAGMEKDMVYEFMPFDSLLYKDSLLKFDYNLFLIVRYTEKCRLKNLPLNIEYASLNRDSVISLNINIPLYNSNGRPVGYGNYGLYETSYALLEKINPEEGFYIAVKTHEENTPGINSLGIVCRKQN